MMVTSMFITKTYTCLPFSLFLIDNSGTIIGGVIGGVIGAIIIIVIIAWKA